MKLKSTVTVATIAILSSISSIAMADFQDVMKAMGKDFKALAMELQAGGFKADAVTIAQDLQQQIQLAQTTAPDTDVLDPNAADYAAKKADFDSLMSQEATLATALVTALQAGDNATATATFGKMDDVRKTGHTKYKPAN